MKDMYDVLEIVFYTHQQTITKTVLFDLPKTRADLDKITADITHKLKLDIPVELDFPTESIYFKSGKVVIAVDFKFRTNI